MIFPYYFFIAINFCRIYHNNLPYLSTMYLRMSNITIIICFGVHTTIILGTTMTRRQKTKSFLYTLYSQCSIRRLHYIFLAVDFFSVIWSRILFIRFIPLTDKCSPNVIIMMRRVITEYFGEIHSHPHNLCLIFISPQFFFIQTCLIRWSGA